MFCCLCFVIVLFLFLNHNLCQVHCSYCCWTFVSTPLQMFVAFCSFFLNYFNKFVPHFITLFTDLRNQFNLIIKPSNYLALRSRISIVSFAIPQVPLLSKDFLHILTQIRGKKNVLGFYFRLVFFMLFYVSLYPLIPFYFVCVCLCCCCWCCCSGSRAYSTPCGCRLLLLHTLLCAVVLCSLSRALSLPLSLSLLVIFLLLCFSSASSLCCFFRCLLCARSFCCRFVVFAFSHACFLFLWAGYSLHSYSPTRMLSLSLSLSFVLLPVLLTVCALCLLLLPLRSQGQVNERFDFFCNSLLTIFLYILLLLLSLRGWREGPL